MVVVDSLKIPFPQGKSDSIDFSIPLHGGRLMSETVLRTNPAQAFLELYARSTQTQHHWEKWFPDNN